MAREPIWRRYARFFGPDVGADVDEEIEFHLETLTAEHVARGVPPALARQRALEQFGDLARARRECRQIDEQVLRRRKQADALDALRQDAGFAARLLRRAPGFTLVAVLTLALGIGANTAIFSVVDQVLLRPLPYPEADRLFRLFSESEGAPQSPYSGPDYLDLRESARSFSHLAAAFPKSITLTGQGDPVRLDGESVSPDFFEVFGVRPEVGRTFAGASPGERLVVLGGDFWRSRFDADPGVVGRVLTLNGEPHTVVGVMPAGFNPLTGSDAWTLQKRDVPDSPFGAGAERERGASYLAVVGRLRPGVEPAAARAELTALQRRLAEEYPGTNANRTLSMVPWREVVVGDGGRPLLLLLGAVGFVLLIACANLANLLLARANSRQREVTIRAALGADRGRLVRQFLTESVLIGVLGGAVGVGVAWFAVRPLEALRPQEAHQLGEASLDVRVLAFALLLSLLSGVVFGLAPALQAGRLELGSSLRGGGRGSSAGRERARAQSLLVVAQVALSLVLLVGAGLMVRSLLRLTGVDPGFRTERVIAVGLPLPLPQYAEEHRQTAFWAGYLERVRAVPGVEAAGAVFPVPLSGSASTASFSVEGRPVTPESQVTAGITWATPGYFESLRIPLRSGRLLTDRDRDDAPPVIVVNETMARQVWPGEDPVGKRLSFDEVPTDSTEWFTVVGVVGDVRPKELQLAPRAELYLPHLQNPWPAMSLVVRTRGEPETVVASLRREAAALDANLPLGEVRTLQEIRDRAVAQPRFRAYLLAAFAALALLLAAVGIYGVVSFSVSQRTREIGVRMALGALPREVVGHFVRRGMRPVVLGLGLGLGAAFLAVRLLSGLLYEVPQTDPVTFALLPAVLVAVAALAALLPARRATRVDPMVILRSE